LVLGADKGVKISKYGSQEELDRVRTIRLERTSSPTPLQAMRVEKPVQKKPLKPMQFGKELTVTDPFLPTKIQSEARRMSEIYGVVYVFENSVRNIIKIVLEDKYGANWWELQVSTPVQSSVKDKIAKEDIKPWHGRRGQHEIFYTVIGDLTKIINKNWEDFKPILHNLENIRSLIDKIETSRNIIAHNNPLDRHDIDRLRINFKDWMRIITDSKEQIEEIRSTTT